MATNLAIDDSLMNNALKIGGLKTKRATVNLALQEFIQRRRVEELLEIFGQVEYEDDYDYKRMRQRP